MDDFNKAFFRYRQWEMHNVGGLEKSVDMVFKMNGSMILGAAIIEDPVSTLGGKITYMKACFPLFYEFAIDKCKSVCHNQSFRKDK